MRGRGESEKNGKTRKSRMRKERVNEKEREGGMKKGEREYMCVCIYVCEREREGGGERGSEKKKDTKKLRNGRS